VPAPLGTPWPAGTTSDWTLNGSSATLVLPAGAEVLHAELLWGGSHYYFTDLRDQIDNDVVLHMGNDSITVAPLPSTELTIEQDAGAFFANYYMRSGDVTAFVEAHKGGTYTIAGVAATEDTGIQTLSAAGWTLIVAYRNGSEPIRNLSIFVGGSFVNENAVQDYTVSGFCAPPSGIVEGNVVVSAIEGDANLTGDILSIAPSVAGTFESLSGPNNPIDNFFGSQINDRTGQLDTSGTFGNMNHNAITGTNVSGGRQGWDLTTVPVSSSQGQLDNNQTTAVIRTRTEGDSYVPVAVALEIDVKAPDFGNSTTSANTNLVQVGDTFEITATLTNTGEAIATGLAFVLDLDPALSLNSYTTDGTPGDSDGLMVDAAALAAGVPAGQLAINATREVKLSVTANNAPLDGTQFIFAPNWNHTFITCDGGPAIDESFTPPEASVPFQGENPTGGGGGAGASAGGMGGAGNGAGGAGASGANTGDDPVEEGSCGCTTIGQEPKGTASVAAFMLAGLFFLRRRRS
jgi:MYXO-CTERM domain-containing protein